MGQRYPVFIGGKRYDALFQTSDEFERGWQSVLRKAHQEGNALGAVRCGCPSQLQRPLYVRARGDQYHLASWPNMGGNHAKNCRYYSLDRQRSGLQCYADDVVRVTSGGMLDVKLSQATEDGKQQIHNLVVNGNRFCQAAMSVTGLLHLLWQESSLNVWYPAMAGKRNFWVVSQQATRTAGRIGSARGNLGQVLIAPASKDSERARLNSQILEDAYITGRKIYILGVMARYTEGDPVALPDSPRFAKPFGYPKVFFGNALLEQMNTLHAANIEAWAAGSRVVMLVQARVQKSQKTKRLYCRAIGAGMMLVSPQWVPVSSHAEQVLEEKLRDAGRAFEKPLRFDSVDSVFPNFWLLDMGEPYPVEVWTNGTPEGAAKRAAKTAYYNAEYEGRWWQWDAAGGADQPALPTAEGKGR